MTTTGAGEVETVTVVRGPGVDTFGDPLPGADTEFDIGGCLIAPRSTAENNFAASQVDTELAVYTPPDIPQVLPTDRMRVRGELHHVVGEPQVWGTFGVVISLRKVTG